MQIFLDSNHNSGTWLTTAKINTKYDRINGGLNIDSLIYEYKNGEILSASKSRWPNIFNQVIYIKDDISYSSISEPDPNIVARRRERIIIQKSLYCMMENRSIDGIIYPPDIAKGESDFNIIRDRNRNCVGGNLNGLITKNVGDALCKYIRSKCNSDSKGALIIQVPKHVPIKNRQKI